MRAGSRRALSWVAIFAVALHAVLWAAAPMAAGTAADPFSVICHNDGTSADQQTPASAPAHVCDHCNLCSAAPALAPDNIAAGDLTPARLLQILQPASTAARDNYFTASNRARGPPVSA
jgi:hypothetical protein